MAPSVVCTKTFKLNNGSFMPAVGLGSWQGDFGSTDETALEESVVQALQSGYRLIDTAQLYGVESVVGRAIRRSGVPRSQITVVTKFWGNYHHDVASALEISLAALGLDYVDFFLMHWPWATTADGLTLRKHESPTFIETWKQMESLDKTRCRGIGVCNFSQLVLDELLEYAAIIPAVNQVELHALNPCAKLVPYCQDKGIHVMGWGTLGGDSPKAKEAILGHSLFKSLAEKYGCPVATISLSWAVQRGTTVIPKSSSKSRIESNTRLVALNDQDMARINEADREIGQVRISYVHDHLWTVLDGEKTLRGWSKVEFGWENAQGHWLT